MAGKGVKFLKNKEVAKLVTENRQPCIFCQQDVDDEVIYGKLYALGDIQCHYFCVLLSCCLVQKGKDTEGLFGFLYKDIIAEVARSKKHKCSYCGRGGASLGCSVAVCRKQFHLPCGRRKNVVSLFYGNYKSFCELHAPKQKISAEVMVNVKLRLKNERMLKSNKKSSKAIKETKQDSVSEPEDSPVCVICYEEVPGYPSTQTFWPPCCGRDAWLHRSCLQRMALSAGMHYIKCPLCNDKEQFYEAVCEQGYYLPDRDAAWELEQNAFAEIYERPESCAAPECSCPFGRSHDEPGIWDIKLCILCGSCGMHAHCLAAERMLCAACRPAANDIDQLESRLASVIRAEQEREARAVRSGPVMPSRMSLRRTKGRMPAHIASSSSQNLPSIEPKIEIKTETPPKESTDRQDLNLKTPKRPKFLEPTILKDLENKLLSPIKMLEQSYMEKMAGMEDLVVNSTEVIERMRAKFNKPKPLSEKKRIVNEILDDLFNNVFKENLENNDLVKKWSSPKKCYEIIEECKKESKENQTVNASESDVSQNLTEEIHENNYENVKTDNIQVEGINLVDGHINAEDTKCIEDMSADQKSNINNSSDKENVTEDINVKKPKCIEEMSADEKININDSSDKENVTEDINAKKPKCIEEMSADERSSVNDSSDKENVTEDINVKKPKCIEEMSADEKINRNDSSDKENVTDDINDKEMKCIEEMRADEKSNINDSSDKENVTEDINAKETKFIEEMSADEKSHINDSSDKENVTEVINAKETKFIEEMSADGKSHINNSSDKENVTEDINAKETKLIEEMSADENSHINDSSDKENFTTKSDDDDDESTSTFKLPPEFIAESDDSINGFDTPKHIKTVDIEYNSSLEISESDDVINIKMIEIGNGKEQEFVKSLIIKSPVRDKKCSLKFGTVDKETLDTNNVGMDVEEFKDHYLNEVDRDFKCNFNHNHIKSDADKVITTAIDFAINATRKRKLDTKGVKERKFKKKKLKKGDDKDVQRVKKFKKKEGRDRNIKMKIKWKDGTEKNKKLKKKQKTKSFKQYVLKYSPVQSSKMIAKPDVDVSPKKRKYIKLEKSPDKLVQTSIQSFFKVV